METTDIRDHQLIILTAPSGAGKTTIAHELLRQLPELTFSISATTRPPREGETAGKDYYFMDTGSFQQKIDEGAFVEYEKVYEGKYYGTLRTELERIWQGHKYPLRVVDVVGAEQLKKLFGSQALSIFIEPPSMDILKQRLQNRGAEDAAGIEERLLRAHKEMAYVDKFDHVVHNEQLPVAIAETTRLIKSFIYSAQKYQPIQ